MRTIRLLFLLAVLGLAGLAARAGEAAPTPADALKAAVDAKQAEAAEKLLAARPELAKEKIAGQTPLHYCIEHGNAAVFTKLLSAGADPNATDDLGRTPLLHAAAELRADFFRAMLNPQAPVANLSSYAKDAQGHDAAEVLAAFNAAALKDFAAKHKGRTPEQLAAARKECAELLAAYRAANSRVAGDEVRDYLPPSVRDFLGKEVAGVSAWRLILAAFFLISAWALCLFWRFITKGSQAEICEQSAGRMILGATRRGMCFFLGCAGLVFAACALSPACNEYRGGILRPVLCVALVIFAYDLAAALEEALRRWLQRGSITLDPTLYALFRRLLRAVAVFYGVIYLYEFYSGSSLTTLLAGLGIGGMAFAFAATDTLKNFIAFALILVDKPFKVGDHVIIGGNDGTVENIGLRTTRVRLSDGSRAIVCIPNSQAVDSAVKNFPAAEAAKTASAPAFLQRTETLTLSRENAPAKVEEALAIVKNLLTAPAVNAEGKKPQVNFTGIGAGLTVSVVYWFTGSDDAAFREFNEKFNFSVLREFAAAGIKLA